MRGLSRAPLSMEFFEAVNRRRSVRIFTSQPVSDAQVQTLLEAANRAPSAGNLQAYFIYVVKDSAIRQRLSAAAGGQAAVADAPVVLVFCAVPSRSAEKYGAKGAQLFCIQDATIACAYTQLAATAMGLSSVWIGAVHELEVVREALALKEGMWPIAFLPIGYPAEFPSPKPRRALAEFTYELS